MIGAGLVATSITSGGDANGGTPNGDKENPHIRFNDNMRGHVRTEITASEMRARLPFLVADHVPRPQDG